MKRLTLTLAALVALALPAAASAHAAAPHCRAGYRAHTVRLHRLRRHGRLVRRHGRVVWVTRVRCEAIKVLATPPYKPTSPPSTPSVRASIDPSYTQNASNPLAVTWSYSAGSPDGDLPAGTLSLTVFQHGQAGAAGGCTINVQGSDDGGDCTVTLPAYGAYDVTVTYSGAPGVAATTQTDTETIAPPPITVADQWGQAPAAIPTVSAATNYAQTSAQVTISDPDFQGASSVAISDGQGDDCTAQVSGTSASCSMSLTGVPSSFTLAYPGGTPQTSTQPVAPNGTQSVTTTWPADTVTIADPTVTRGPAPAQAPVSFDDDDWSITPCSSPSLGVCNAYNGHYPLSDPLSVNVGDTVTLGASALGQLASDPNPLGTIAYTITGPAGGYSAVNPRYSLAASDPGAPAQSQDCSATSDLTGEASSGLCQITFSHAGTYIVSTAFTDTDGVYPNGTGPSETIYVLP